MARKKRSDEQLLQQPRYKSVLTILEIFSGNYGEFKPLEPKHILYILKPHEKHNREIEKYLYGETMDNSKPGQKYKQLIEESIKATSFKSMPLERGIIQENIDSTQLNRVLNELVYRGWVKRFGKQERYYKYALTPKYYCDSIKKAIIKQLEQVLSQDLPYFEYCSKVH